MAFMLIFNHEEHEGHEEKGLQGLPDQRLSPF